MIVAGGALSAALAAAHLPRDRRLDILAVLTAAFAGAAAMLIAPDVSSMGPRLLIVVLAAAAVVDIRSLRIPNQLSFAAACCALAAWAGGGMHVAPLVVAGGVAVMMVVAFVFAGAGGGDVKMLPPLVLACVARVEDLAMAVLAGSVLLFGTFLLALTFHFISGASRRGYSALGPSMLLAGLCALAITGSL